MQNDIWLNDDEYPDEKDIDAYGYNSPPDDDPLTIGYIGDSRPTFWTPKRIGVLIVVLLLLGALLLPPILRLLS